MEACFFISISPFIIPGAQPRICLRFWASLFCFFCFVFLKIKKVSFCPLQHQTSWRPALLVSHLLIFLELRERDGGWLCFRRFTAGSHLCQVQRLKESDERRAGDREKQMEDRPVRQWWRRAREQEGMKRRMRAKKVMRKGRFFRECRMRIHKIEEKDGVSEHTDLWKNRLVGHIYYLTSCFPFLTHLYFLQYLKCLAQNVEMSFRCISLFSVKKFMLLKSLSHPSPDLAPKLSEYQTNAPWSSKRKRKTGLESALHAWVVKYTTH